MQNNTGKIWPEPTRLREPCMVYCVLVYVLCGCVCALGVLWACAVYGPVPCVCVCVCRVRHYRRDFGVTAGPAAADDVVGTGIIATA